MPCVLARWDWGWQCKAWPPRCSKSLLTTNKLHFLLNSDKALMHSATVTNEWPVVTGHCRLWATRSRQKADKADKTLTRHRQDHHMAVFFTFRLKCQGLCGREGHCTRCKPRKSDCVAGGHKPTDSSCLNLIPQPLFLIACLCCWFHWQCLHSLHGLWIHGLHSLQIHGLHGLQIMHSRQQTQWEGLINL